jgi:hypothetical protein
VHDRIPLTTLPRFNIDKTEDEAFKTFRLIGGDPTTERAFLDYVATAETSGERRPPTP